MSEEAQRVYLTQRMQDHLDDFDFPISMPNQPFNIPKEAPYGEFYIISGPQAVVVSGEGRGRVRARYVGYVQLTIWLPKDTGTKVATEAKDIFKDLFQFHQGRDSAGSIYVFKTLQPFTPQTKVGWECAVVRVPFHRDSTETVTISI